MLLRLCFVLQSPSQFQVQQRHVDQICHRYSSRFHIWFVNHTIIIDSICTSFILDSHVLQKLFYHATHMHSAVYAVIVVSVCPSVGLSVYHTRVLCRNNWAHNLAISIGMWSTGIRVYLLVRDWFWNVDYNTVFHAAVQFATSDPLVILRASAMLKHVIAIGLTSVRPSVRPSHAGTVSKRLDILSCFLHHTIAHSF